MRTIDCFGDYDQSTHIDEIPTRPLIGLCVPLRVREP
jgi:hypothetical protein